MGKRLKRATEAGLLERYLDDDGYFLYELSPKGESFLGQENPDEEKGVIDLVEVDEKEDVTYTLSADLLDTLDEIADDEDRDINEVVEELLSAGLDVLYEEEGEESEELETR